MTNSSTIIATTRLHTGRKFNYEEVVVRSMAPTGTQREHARQLVRHPGAVVVVPILPATKTEPERVVLIRVYRASMDAMSWECCAGTIERARDAAGGFVAAGEPAEACAARELEEETGYRAATLIPLGAFRTSPGLSDEVMHAYAAAGLTHVGQKLEEDEQIEVHAVAAPEALAMVDRGEIADGKSIAALLLAARRGLI